MRNQTRALCTSKNRRQPLALLRRESYPIRVSHDQDSSSNAPPKGTAPKAQTVVLVVDDDDDHNLVMTLSLAALDYDVVAADSCSAALAAIAERRVDVIVSDFSLGDGSALDLMNGIGEARPKVAVVLTGFDDVSADVHRVFDEVLLKPTTVDVIDAVVKARLARKPLAKASIETMRRRGAA